MQNDYNDLPIHYLFLGAVTYKSLLKSIL